MLKVVEVACPAKISLFLNVNDYSDTKNQYDTRMINQTINLYDNIIIQEKRGPENILINTSIPLVKEEIENYYKIVKLFLEYTNIKTGTLKITVNKSIPSLSGLGGLETDIAGILIGLNKYYCTDLTTRELMFLGSLINKNVAYFIHAGCCKITNFGDKIETYKNNPYTSYLIINPNINIDLENMLLELRTTKLLSKNIPNNIVHNDFLSVIPSDIKKIREFLTNYKLDHSLSGIGSSYFIAFREKAFNFKIRTSLKTEFPNCKFYNVENAPGHRVLTKYLNYKK